MKKGGERKRTLSLRYKQNGSTFLRAGWRLCLFYSVPPWERDLSLPRAYTECAAEMGQLEQQQKKATWHKANNLICWLIKLH